MVRKRNSLIRRLLKFHLSADRLLVRKGITNQMTAFRKDGRRWTEEFSSGSRIHGSCVQRIEKPDRRGDCS